MGGYCSGGCCGDTSSALQVSKQTGRRPWKGATKGFLAKKTRSAFQGSLTLEAESINDTSSFDRTSDLVFRNYLPKVSSSSGDVVHRSSTSMDVETKTDEDSAILQLLVHITDLLSTNSTYDASMELEIPFCFRQSLQSELDRLSTNSGLQRLPTLMAIFNERDTQSPLSTNKHELQVLERELFTFLVESGNKNVDYLLTLQRCLISQQVKPPYTRFLQLHLSLLLQHPNVRENTQMTTNLKALSERLQSSTHRLDLNTDDSNLLLELITMANVPLFDPVSTPPVIFNHPQPALISAAMRISRTAVELRKLADSGHLLAEKHGKLLEEIEQNSLTPVSKGSNYLACFYEKFITAEKRSQIGGLAGELLRTLQASTASVIPPAKMKEVLDVSMHLADVALLCAKCTVARAHYVVKNRFRLTPTTCRRICVIETSDQQLLKDALCLLGAAGVSKGTKIDHLTSLLNGEFDLELSENEATYLEHILTRGLDFQPLERALSLSHNHIPSQEVIESPVSPTDDRSVTQSSFSFVETAETKQDFKSDMQASIRNFFDQNEENVYEIDSLIRPSSANLPQLTPEGCVNFNSSRSDLVSTQRTLPLKDSQIYFKLLPETILLRNLIAGMQRSPTKLFTYKLAPFQIIQLCDCVRKLSSVEPRMEDGKLIKKLSCEANRRLKVNLSSKTIVNLRKFYHRIHTPVLQSSSGTLMRVIAKQVEISGNDVSASVCLNLEGTFCLVEICSPILFYSIDYLSLYFLEQIKEKCLTCSDSSLILSFTEFIKLRLLTKQASRCLEKFGDLIVSCGDDLGNASRLLSLYQMRALLQSMSSDYSVNVSKRLLWKHALSKFFQQYPEKATKKVYSDLGFNVFIAESDCLPDSKRDFLLSELEVLISACEGIANSSAELFNNLLSPKMKRSKFTDALKSKFAVSSVNNRQLNCDPTVVGQWISSLESNRNKNISTYFSEKTLEEIRQFLLTQPQTQEQNEIELAEKISLSGSDKNLASFEPPALTKIVSMLSGSAQRSSQCKLSFVLLLEALMYQYDHATVAISRSILMELLGSTEPPTMETDVIQETCAVSLANAAQPFEDKEVTFPFDEARTEVTEILLNTNKMASPKQYNLAVTILRHLRTIPSHDSNQNQTLCEMESLKTGIHQFEPKVKSFLTSDNSLLHAIVLLRGLRLCIKSKTDKQADHADLIFVLAVCRFYLSPDLPLLSATLSQEKHLRNALANDEAVELNIETLDQLQTFLEQKLNIDLSITITQSIAKLSDSASVTNVSLINTLQFICIAVALLPVDIELKFLVMLLSRPISNLSSQVIALVRAILVELSTQMQRSCSRDGDPIRLLIPLLPLTLGTEDEKTSVTFDKLVTTICVANGLIGDLTSADNSNLNGLLAEIFWTVFFNRERLTSGGIFGRFYRETANVAFEWLANNTKPNAERPDDFFHNLFYNASKIALDETSSRSQIPHEKNSMKEMKACSELELNFFEPESYFHVLQSLLIIKALVMHTSPQTKITLDNLLILYHAAVICLHSGYLDGRLEGKVALTNILVKIEKAHRSASPEISLSSLLFSTPHIRKPIEGRLIGASKSAIEDLRSHIVPVILPPGSELGDPFMNPDPVLVQEGLAVSLCGFFRLSPSDVRSTLGLLSRINLSTISTTDLAESCRIINNLFQEYSGRFTCGKVIAKMKPNSLKEVMDAPIAVELAMANLDIFSSNGSLQSADDVSIFLKSILTLSRSVRLRTSKAKTANETALSETVITSPTESFSSFIVSENVTGGSGTDAFRSLDSSPYFEPHSKERTPIDNYALNKFKRLNVKGLIDQIRNEDVFVEMNSLIDGCHYSRLLLQSRTSKKEYVAGLKNVFATLSEYIPDAEKELTPLQIKDLSEISCECADRFSQALLEALKSAKFNVPLRFLLGHFSLALPTSTEIPTAAHEIAFLHLADVIGELNTEKYGLFIEKNLLNDPRNSHHRVTFLALQGALKATEGFVLTIEEKICLFYSLVEEAEILFFDLSAAIYWARVWPVKSTDKQRQYLDRKVVEWTESVDNSSISPRWILKSIEDVCKSAGLMSTVNISTGQEDCSVEPIYVNKGSEELYRLMRQLREVLKESSYDTADIGCSAVSLLGSKAMDEFVLLGNIKALQLVSDLLVISERTDWFSTIRESVTRACNRLCLAVACNLSFKDSTMRVELPTVYIHSHELRSAILCQLNWIPHTTLVPASSHDRLSLPQSNKDGCEMNFRKSGSSLNFTSLIRSRIKGAHSLGTVFRDPISAVSELFPQTHHHHHHASDWTDFSTPSSLGSHRSSLSHLQELIEIRRAVVSGSAKELRRLGYGRTSEAHAHPQNHFCKPDKLDLSLLRKRCEEHTQYLLFRAAYENEQSEICSKAVQDNLNLLDILSMDKEMGFQQDAATREL